MAPRVAAAAIEVTPSVGGAVGGEWA